MYAHLLKLQKHKLDEYIDRNYFWRGEANYL